MLTAAQVLAENNFGDTRTGGLAGPMGLFIILLLAIATIALIRNMNARLRRLPDKFPGDERDEVERRTAAQGSRLTHPNVPAVSTIWTATGLRGMISPKSPVAPLLPPRGLP
jgi:hypothetical protein